MLDQSVFGMSELARTLLAAALLLYLMAGGRNKSYNISWFSPGSLRREIKSKMLSSTSCMGSCSLDMQGLPGEVAKVVIEHPGCNSSGCHNNDMSKNPDSGRFHQCNEILNQKTQTDSRLAIEWA